MTAHLSTAPGPDGGREDAPGPADEERADTGNHLALEPQTQVRPWRRGRFSSLTFRILALNLIALVALVGGLLYLNQFREGLVDARVEALLIEGQIIAGALGESAVDRESEAIALDADAVRQIVRRTTEPTTTRARIFGADGALLADSRTASQAGRARSRKRGNGRHSPARVRTGGRGQFARGATETYVRPLALVANSTWPSINAKIV